MATIVSADLHLNPNSVDSHRHDFMETTLPEMIKKHKATNLIVLGDLTDVKDHHGAELVNKIVSHFANLAKLCHVMVLRGNHDAVIEDSPFFAFIQEIKNITWIGKPTAMEFGDIGKVLFLPHSQDPKNDWKVFVPRKTNFIFAHNTFQGAQVGARALEGTPLNIFPKGSRVISGDIHNPQIIESDGVTLEYVGAPFRTNFGDEYDPRVLLLSGSTIKSIPCPGPRKQLFELWDMQDLPQTAYCTKGGFQKGDIFKVRVHVDSDQFEHWPNIKKEVLAWGGRWKYIIHMVQPIMDHAAKSRKMINTSKKSDGEQLRAYGKRRGVSEKVLETGLELLGKV